MTERDEPLTGLPGAVGHDSITSKGMSAPTEPSSRPDTTRSEVRGRRRLDLDVVRGLAILLALGAHFSKEPSGDPVLDVLAWPGDTFGWAGVDLFFVLSGFLLGRLVLTEQLRTGRFDGRRFTARRLLKLWPVLYLFLAVQVLVGPERESTYLWQNALHLQNYAGTSLTHLWSLAVEEHFYLALAVLFPLFARRRFSPRALAVVLGGILVAALALRCWGSLEGVSEVRLQWRTHFRVDSLTAGVLLALVSVHWPERFEQVRRQRALLLGVLALGVAWLSRIGKDTVLGSTLGYTVTYLTAAALLLLLFRAPWVTRARWVTAPVAFLGRYSYGIYIWHLFAAAVAMELAGWTPHDPEPAAVLTRYAVAIAVGVVATAVVEKPVLRLRDRLLPARDGRREPTPPAPAAPAASRVPVGASA
jgi:peptidoglycan/LPS O-acetylase OafA/YrhL